jgi:myo-inositol-1(or 4)-monophosphatase
VAPRVTGVRSAVEAMTPAQHDTASELLERVAQAVRRVAAEEIMPRFLNVAHQRKADGSVFTEADVAAQDALVRRLREIRPLPLIGEEMSEAQQAERWLAGDRGLWCVDPIDGTSNFVNGVPYFAVSVALMQQGRSVLGVVYNPAADEMFCAHRGRGAWLNGERLPQRPARSRLRGAIAGIDFKRLPARLAAALAAQAPYASQRNFGAGTLDWCYAAAGRFDVYLHGGQKLWDYAAGAVLLEEAGGQACTLDRDDFWGADLWHRSVIASANPVLLAQWRDWIRAHL